jgi:transcriptional regulator with XRE-family HTH domain
MDDLKVGTVVRAVRRRRGLRQRDVAMLAGVGQWAVSAVERGQFERLSVSALRRVCAVLEIRMPFDPMWRGGQLARLADAKHAALVERVVRLLGPAGWDLAPEYTFSHFGERGSVDVLGWHPARRALLVLEIKTELDDLQDLLSVLDRKARLVPALLAAERGWRCASLGVVLALVECSTSRDAVARHQATFAAALPKRNLDIRRWLAQPGSEGLRGIWFLRPSDKSTLMEGRGGPRRIRRPSTSRLAAPAPSNRPEQASTRRGEGLLRPNSALQVRGVRDSVAELP